MADSNLLKMLNEAIANLQTGQNKAVSRITKTPINFVDKQTLEPSNAIGNYQPNEKIINLATKLYTGQNPDTYGLYLDGPYDYKKFSEVLHHEDTHALLDKTHQTPLYFPPSSGPLVNQIVKMFSFKQPEIVNKVNQAFTESGRNGSIEQEPQAYMTAYNPNNLRTPNQLHSDIPGSISLTDRNNYLIELLNHMKTSKERELLQRLITNYNSTQELK